MPFARTCGSFGRSDTLFTSVKMKSPPASRAAIHSARVRVAKISSKMPISSAAFMPRFSIVLNFSSVASSGRPSVATKLAHQRSACAIASAIHWSSLQR